MKLVYLLAASLCACALNATAQSIKRKGGLGVNYYQNTPDSLISRLSYAKGAVIISALPNTTAASLGLLPNDIVTQVNGQVISKPSDLGLAAKILRADDDITLTLIRKGALLTVNGKVKERPRETSPNAEVIYGEFKYKEGYVRTIYKTLKGRQPLGTVFFLQGLPCYSMDNFQPLDKTKQALDAMVERGFAVYRMEKGDMGDNMGTPPCETMGYHEELAMYEAGYRHLLTLKAVDTTKILLFGHSMGGTTAPLLAEKFQPRGVVVYGTGFKPWAEYLCDAYLIQPQYYGEDLAELRPQLEAYKPYLYEFFYGNKPLDDILKQPMGRRAMQEILGYNPLTKQAASGRSPQTFKELNQAPVAKAWGNVENDVLAIYGECDINANNAEDMQKLIAYINQKRPGKGTFWLAKGTSHTFEEVGTMDDYIKWQAKPQAYAQYAATRFNPKVFDYACDWMKTVLSKPPQPRKQAWFKDASDLLPDDGTKTAAMDVVALDVDDDQDLDIVLANEFQPNSVLINNGGHFTNESRIRLPQIIHDSEDIAVADFNGDDKQDLIFCSEDDQKHEYYLNQGKGIFAEAPYRFPDSEANAVKTFDVNRDGKPDVLFGNNGSNTLFLNDGTGKFKVDEKRMPKIERITQDLALLDVDNDGDLDILEGNEDGNILLLNNGKGIYGDATPTHLPTGADIETRKIAYADVDQDGDLDVFLANVAFKAGKNPQDRLYINNGKGKFDDQTTQRFPPDLDHSIDAVFVDLNQDNYPDLLVANVFGGYLKAYLNDGKGAFIEQTDEVFGKKYVRDALGIIVTDFNNDGLRDLYVCDRYNPAFDKKDLLLLGVRR
jgi:pimeloyl-ACP methyl ester carboxylesterase